MKLPSSMAGPASQLHSPALLFRTTAMCIFAPPQASCSHLCLPSINLALKSYFKRDLGRTRLLVNAHRANLVSHQNRWGLRIRSLPSAMATLITCPHAQNEPRDPASSCLPQLFHQPTSLITNFLAWLIFSLQLTQTCLLRGLPTSSSVHRWFPLLLSLIANPNFSFMNQFLMRCWLISFHCACFSS